MFETRWRWNAMRSLALLRSRGRQARAPCPAADARAGSARGGVSRARPPARTTTAAAPIEVPDHPLVRETVRDCLVEAMDAAGLRAVLEALADGRIAASARERPEPSVFSHEILNANPYAFLDDAPLEERRTRAVSRAPRAARRRRRAHRRARSRGGRGGGRRGAARTPRDADELHDLLLDLGALPEAIGRERGWARPVRGAGRRLGAPPASTGVPLPLGRRRAPLGRGAAVWPDRRVHARRGRAAVAPGRAWPTATARSPRSCAATSPSWARRPPTASRRAWAFGRPTSTPRWPGWRWRARRCAAASCVDAADDATQWCDRRLLARINRRMLDGLRREIEPVSAADFIRFLFGWQHVRPGSQLHGQPGLARVIAQLQGFEAAAGAWEREILPARVVGLRPGVARRALPLGRRQLGTPRAPGPPAAHRAARRRSRWCGAPICRGCWRPDAEAATTRRCRPPRASVLAFLRARRRQLPRRDHRRHAPPARRGRRRAVASWCPPGGSPATGSRACAR